MRDQISDNAEPVQRLATLAEDHLSTSDKHPGVAEMKKKFSRIQENWRVLNEGAESLLVAMAPWKEMTDRFDELQDWFDRFRERVRRDLSNIEQEEDNSANMSDYIVSLKVYTKNSIDDVMLITKKTTEYVISIDDVI